MFSPQNVDCSLNSLHYLVKYSGTISCFKRFKKGVSDVSEVCAKIDKTTIILKLCEILGGTELDYDLSAPIKEYGIDSLSSMELVNWINKHVKKHIMPSFIDETLTIDLLYLYCKEHQS